MPELETVAWLLAAYALIFAINVVPAFMPSSWMVMAFFYVKFGLPLVVLTVGGAIISGLGRLMLAKASHGFSGRCMRTKQSDLEYLGRYLDEHRRFAGPATFLYTLSPFPTNNLFVAAGLVGVNLTWVLAGFWAGRIIADTFWVWTTNKAFDSFGDVFGGAIDGRWAIALQILSVLSVLLLYRLPWARWLRRAIDGAESPAGGAAHG